MDTQVIKIGALKKSAELTNERLDREHVSLFIRNNPDIFSTINIFSTPDLFWPDLGLTLDLTLNKEFESNQKHKNYIFSSGIDLIYEFFNLERKTKNEFLSKSLQYFNKNPSINNIFTKIADKGLLF